MLRSQIQLAPYNPRSIDKHSKSKLRKSLERFGLVEPLIWNKRTQTLVGGHQRISVLDEEYAGEDYEVTVAVVDLEPDREKQLNVILNNESVMGTWDFDRLESLLLSPGIDVPGMGFDRIDLASLMPHLDVNGLFNVEKTDPGLTAKKELQTIKEAIDAANPKTKPTDNTEAVDDPREEMRENKRKENNLQRAADDSVNFVLKVVFQNTIQRERFLAQIDLETDTVMVDGVQFAAAVGVNLDADSAKV